MQSKRAIMVNYPVSSEGASRFVEATCECPLATCRAGHLGGRPGSSPRTAKSAKICVCQTRSKPLLRGFLYCSASPFPKREIIGCSVRICG